LLTSVPNNNYDYINTSCKWLNPDNDRLSNLVKIQRKCKKYLQKRREVILYYLLDYLPRDVILYCVM